MDTTTTYTTTYTVRLRDPHCGPMDETFETADWAEAEEHAREWIAYGYPHEDETYWVSGELREGEMPEDEDDGEWDYIGVEIEPAEPACTEAEHDWQAPVEIVGGIDSNPGVWGHGGGVVIYECCMHCGCARITDTWAQDRETGEQGLTTVRYDEGHYTGLLTQLDYADAA